MVNACVIAKVPKTPTYELDFIPENFPVFGFLQKKIQKSIKKWITFVNRKDWTPMQHGGICSKHFEERYLKVGKQRIN